MAQVVEVELAGRTLRLETGRVAKQADGAVLASYGDTVVLATGYRFEMPFLPKEVIRASFGHPVADECQSRSSPGLFFLGTPCARGLSSEFLRGIASDAPVLARRVRQWLTVPVVGFP